MLPLRSTLVVCLAICLCNVADADAQSVGEAQSFSARLTKTTKEGNAKIQNKMIRNENVLEDANALIDQIYDELRIKYAQGARPDIEPVRQHSFRALEK